MKRVILFLMVVVANLSYSALRLKIIEPIRFGEVNIKAVGDVIVGEGTIEVFSDDLEADRNKKFVFKFPKKGLMTNKKRWVEIEKYDMKDVDKEFRLIRDKKLVKVYAFVNRNTLNSKLISGEDLQGEYVGYVPVIVEQYGKPTVLENKDKSEDKIENSQFANTTKN